MDARGIQKLKEFFQALKAAGFKFNPILPSFVDKPYCLQLLRRLPQFQAEQFKNDNVLINTLIEYLKDPAMKEVFLAKAGFTQDQQKEFVEALKEEKPTEGTAVSEQPSGQEEPVPTGEPSATMADQGTPRLPWSPSVSSAPHRVIHNIPRDKPPLGGREGGTGAGTAATNKTARLAEGLASDAGIGIKKGSTRLGSAFSNFLGGLGRAGGSMLGGAIGGGGRFLGKIGIGGLNIFGNLSDEVVRRRATAKGLSSKRVVFLFIGGFIMLTFLTGLTAAPGPGGPGGPSPSPGTTPQPVTAVASCPVIGGTISTASYNADSVRGHCSLGYRGCRPECRTTGRRAKAIDIRATNKDVVLPTLQGQPVQWTLINPPYQIAANDGGGWGYTFSTVVGGTTWYLDMLHLLRSSTVNPNGIYPSSHVIGRVDSAALQAVTSEPHVHVTIGSSLTTPISPGSLSTDCDAGWIPSDFMCQ